MCSNDMCCSIEDDQKWRTMRPYVGLNEWNHHYTHHYCNNQRRHQMVQCQIVGRRSFPSNNVHLSTITTTTMATATAKATTIAVSDASIAFNRLDCNHVGNRRRRRTKWVTSSIAITSDRNCTNHANTTNCCPNLVTKCTKRPTNCSLRTTTTATKFCDVSKMARTICGLPSSHLPFFVLLLCLCLSVISAHTSSPPSSANLPIYSQYYPTYYDHNVHRTTFRSGKSRQFGKSPSINPRQYLDQTFSGGTINGVQVLRSTKQNVINGQHYNSGQPDYRITTDIIIPTNARLEIEPGVKISLAPGIAIKVQGSIFANVSH